MSVGNGSLLSQVRLFFWFVARNYMDEIEHIVQLLNILDSILKTWYSSDFCLCFSGGTLTNLRTTQRAEKF